MSPEGASEVEPGGTPPAGGLVGRTSRGSPAAFAGIAFAVLLGVGWLLFRASPAFDADQAELAAYAASAARRRASMLGALYVVPLAAIAFMWFSAALRDRLVSGTTERSDSVLASVQLMAAMLFVVALFLMAALELALVWRVQAGEGPVDAARLTLSIGKATSELIALRASAVFVMVSTARASRSGLFPPWFGPVSIALGLTLLLVGLRGNVALYAFPAWVVGTSVLIVSRRADQDQGVVP